ncbi:iron chaperone [Crocinitomix algicola]|uniref:iron chaperone n=1 Tax=Crocinitomix algicola TaxID=1740263 RepID=UPI000872FE0E|nr:DUF1801 domain-containing protein [Crocinitomix algicola]
MIFNTIDQYVSNFPPSIRTKLEELRLLIAKNAPEASEKISYNMPTFYLNGNLVHFAGYKNYISLYGVPTNLPHLQHKINKFAIRKDSIQFPIDQPLPVSLIEELIRTRVMENIAQPA